MTGPHGRDGRFGCSDERPHDFQRDHWQARLDELRAANHVPGATRAVLVDREIHEFATGVLNRTTGVGTTTDSVFRLGSVAKVYTATLVVNLVEAGLLDLDAPVRAVLPDFKVADEEASRTTTPRQLLSHTSGLSGDSHLDTGRGDDCVARYVDGCANPAQHCPPGTTVSYSGSGYVVLGRIVEVLTGMTWEPGVAGTGPRAAGPGPHDDAAGRPAALPVRHGPPRRAGQDPYPAPVWEMMPRGFGPGAIVCAAADVVRLAKAHLDGGASVLTRTAWRR